MLNPAGEETLAPPLLLTETIKNAASYPLSPRIPAGLATIAALLLNTPPAGCRRRSVRDL